MPDWTAQEHAARVDAVRAAIAEGETYQCNLTTRLRSRFTGDAFGLYGELAHRQRGGHHAFLDLGRHTVVSASPESFITWEGDWLRTAPMKGTAPRGRSPQQDRAAREALRASEKDRAENVMIVDLLRNDLARVCDPGSVQVSDLLRAEAYPTLWQLTSTVQGRPRDDVGLVEVLEALFPCGSITGAPKLSTMALIAELEDAPRGAYCGALGWIAPGPRARFNVAIRTVTIDSADGSAVYGAGGGVTWASTAEAEYEELLVKAAVLPTGTREPFALLETFAVEGGVARNLAAHLERLLDSAALVRIPVDREELEDGGARCGRECRTRCRAAAARAAARWNARGRLPSAHRGSRAGAARTRHRAHRLPRRPQPPQDHRAGALRRRARAPPRGRRRGAARRARPRRRDHDRDPRRTHRRHLVHPAAGRRMPGRRGPGASPSNGASWWSAR